LARFNAYSEYTLNLLPPAFTTAKKIVAAASEVESKYVDCHSWFTTLQNEIFPSVTNQDHYVAYVENVVREMDIPGVKTFMVMNEPPALYATTSNNDFILRVIAAAKDLTDKPVSVRFMAGYSPSTGHYSPAIDEACDFLARNTYWDARNPGVTVYGTTESKLQELSILLIVREKRSGSQSLVRKTLILQIKLAMLLLLCSMRKVMGLIGFSVGLVNLRDRARHTIFGMVLRRILRSMSWLIEAL
jgi:hypothetical protein